MIPASKSPHSQGASPRLSVENVCEAFWDLESQLGLLEWRIDDVAVWPLLRMGLYYKIAQQLGLYDQPHPALKSKHRMSTVERLFSRVASALPRRAANASGIDRARSKRPYAVIIGDRRVEGRDLHTHALCSELGERALTLDTSAAPVVSDTVLGYRALCETFRSRIRSTISAGEGSGELGDAVRQRLRARLGVDVGDIRSLGRRRAVLFTKERAGFADLFARSGTKTLFAVNAYNRFSAVAGAMAVGAHVVELQHGFTSRFHLGYSWPTHPQVPYAPDEFWTFGQFWIDSTPLARQTKTRIIGAPYVQELARFAEGERESDLVVFTSQGVIGQRLAALAVETARRRPDLRIVFRLHPNEVLSEFEHLSGPGMPANFSVSHRTPNIFALLARAEIQVGVFSTTLLEGMALGARTMLVSLPGIEYMRPIIARGDAVLADGIDDLIAKLDEAPACKDPSYYYAPPEARLVR